LESDPNELRNTYGNIEYANIQKDLKKEIEVLRKRYEESLEDPDMRLANGIVEPATGLLFRIRRANGSFGKGVLSSKHQVVYGVPPRLWRNRPIFSQKEGTQVALLEGFTQSVDGWFSQNEMIKYPRTGVSTNCFQLLQSLRAF